MKTISDNRFQSCKIFKCGYFVTDSRELSDITSVSLLSSVDSLSATQIEKPSVSDLHLEQPARHTASNAQVEQPTKLSDDTMVEQPSTSKSACRSMKKDKEQGKPVIPLQSVQGENIVKKSSWPKIIYMLLWQTTYQFQPPCDKY